MKIYWYFICVFAGGIFYNMELPMTKVIDGISDINEAEAAIKATVGPTLPICVIISYQFMRVEEITK